MFRRSILRKRYVQKDPLETVSLPASIAWSTIAVLLLLGVLQTFGDFQPALETTFGFTLVILIPCGGLISLGLFKAARWKANGGRRPPVTREEAGILKGDVRAWWISVISPLENLLARKGWNPNVITGLSFGFSLVGGVFFWQGWLFLAAWMVLFAGTLDMLDGRIARKTGRVSRRGAFFDSVLDRYGELLIFAGLAVLFRHSMLLLVVVLLALAGSLMVSYARARAEGLGVPCKVGVMQRPERIVFLGFGAMFSSILTMLREILGADLGPLFLGGVILVLALLANYTAASRVVHVMRELRRQESAASNSGTASSGSV